MARGTSWPNPLDPCFRSRLLRSCIVLDISHLWINELVKKRQPGKTIVRHSKVSFFFISILNFNLSFSSPANQQEIGLPSTSMHFLLSPLQNCSNRVFLSKIIKKNYPNKQIYWEIFLAKFWKWILSIVKESFFQISIPEENNSKIFLPIIIQINKSEGNE